MTKIEQEILDIINTTIDGEYIGKLRVCHEDNIWELRIYLDRWFTPTVMACEGAYDEFKKFIQKEFKTRKMQKVQYYSITKYPLVPEQNIEHDE